MKHRSTWNTSTFFCVDVAAVLALLTVEGYGRKTTGVSSCDLCWGGSPASC